MPNPPYRTAPEAIESMPSGIPYIISNECAERFSFYGMRTILTVFMTQYLVDREGNLAVMGDTEATQNYHTFVWAAYLFPVLGSLISDALWGKYKTIMILSFFYVIGHFVLAIDDTRLGLAAGLTLIAIGAGGIKPCVSAHVGDQFGSRNEGLLPKVYAWFYFSINLGAMASTLLTPWLLEHYGPPVAFAVPGLLMIVATAAFWMGRHKFAHISPAGMGAVRDMVRGEGLAAIRKLGVIYLFIAMFWALFEQTGSRWVLQAQHMDLELFGIVWNESQVQAANPFFILVLIPVFTYGVYPLLGRFFRLTEMRKIAIGMFLTVVPFLISAWIDARIAGGGHPSIGWQLFSYLLLTSAEVMVSITGLEFSYTQAPRKMKSFIMALFFLSISLGNGFTAVFNKLIRTDGGEDTMDGVTYYLTFAGLMFVSAVMFSIYARFYKGKRYLQEEAAPA